MNLTRRLLIAALRRTFQKPSPVKQKVLIGSVAAGFAGSVVYVSSLDSIEDVTEIGIIRFGRAASTVAWIVVDYKLSLRGLLQPSVEYDIAMKSCHTRSAEKLLALAKSNGGVFIKVGQHIAALEYLVPPEYTEVLSVLMSNAPQQPLKDVKFVLEQELGKPMNELFDEFSERPVGAASLAQVHVAKLKKTDEKVAVKIQHRRVYENSKTDTNTMEFLVNVADKLFPEFRLMWLVDEVKKNLPNELDFLHEARNADRARERFCHLTFLKDTHPGNVLVNKKPSGEVEVVLLDHGLYLDVNDHIRSLYSKLWLSLLNADQQGIKDVAREMGVGELYGLFACMVARRSWKSVTEGVGNSTLQDDEQEQLKTYVVSLLPQISEVLSRMPREMLLILKTNDLLRNMEFILECHKRQDSMIEVSKCVVRSHHQLAMEKTDERLRRLHLKFSMCWSLLRIRIYELYLVITDRMRFSF